MDILDEIIGEIVSETVDDYDDVFYDANSPPEDEELFTLWDEDLSRRLEALQGKKDDILDRVVDLIADVPQLRREVVRLREEVRLLRAGLKVSGNPPSEAPSSSETPSSRSPSSQPPPLPLPKKKRKRKRRKKSAAASFIVPPPAPLHHSTPAPFRHPPPPPPAEPPYTTVTRSPQRPLLPPIINVHFYHDSNNKCTTQQDIQTTINNIHEMTNKPKQTYNITLHKTFTLQRTLKDIKTRNLKDSVIIIDTTTNNAKYDHEDQTSPHHTHNTLRNIILTLQQKHVNNKNIIILETIPSFKFDTHPYNLAAAAMCKQLGVRFCPNLVGEPHLSNDGIHVLHQHRPQHVSSVAIVGVDPHKIFRIERPPLGPYGPWRFTWGSQNRPVPTSRRPPPGLLSSRSAT